MHAYVGNVANRHAGYRRNTSLQRGLSHPCTLHRPPISTLLCPMAQPVQYDFNWAAPGDTANEVVDSGGEEQLLRVPAEYWMVTQVKGLQATQDPHDALFVLSPMWQWVKMMEYSLYMDVVSLDPNWYLADSTIHAETLAYLAAALVRWDFHKKADGSLKEWRSVEHFASELGAFARTVKKKGTDIAPITIYGEDVVTIPNTNPPPLPVAQPSDVVRRRWCWRSGGVDATSVVDASVPSGMAACA
jgi:hypothetical protein